MIEQINNHLTCRTCGKLIKNMMTNTLFLILYCLFIVIESASAMVPDEEALRNPKFVADYGCLTDHFLIKGYFEKEAWQDALAVVESLELKGYSDRALTVTEGKIFFRMGAYKKALERFQHALQEDYKCGLTIPRIINSVPLPEFADQGRIWVYIYQAYKALGNSKEASAAYNIAVNFLWKSRSIPVDIPIEDKIRDESDFKVFIKKMFIIYDLYQKPLPPF